jgi:hypothetical protein
MTPKEKAEAMVLKYTILINYDFVSDLKFNNLNDEDRNRRVKKDAKKCALAALKLIIEQNNIWIMYIGKGNNNYWEQVKQEIEKL